MRIASDEMSAEPAREIAQALAGRQPVYLFRFAYARPEDAKAFGGAPHASEIPFAFDTVAVRPTPKMIPQEKPVAKLMHRYWMNFVKTGRPDSSGNMPAWPRVQVGKGTVQCIDGRGARNIPDPIKARLDYIESRAGH